MTFAGFTAFLWLFSLSNSCVFSSITTSMRYCLINPCKDPERSQTIQLYFMSFILLTFFFVLLQTITPFDLYIVCMCLCVKASSMYVCIKVYIYVCVHSAPIEGEHHEAENLYPFCHISSTISHGNSVQSSE